jgi:hypothetical protein
MRTLSFQYLAALLIPLLSVAGCSHQQNSYQGSASPALVEFQKLSIDGSEGCRVTCPHYRIYSTVPDSQLLHRLANLLEGAREEYRSLAPDVLPTDHPMDCYLFESRSEWAAFTKAHTGEDAPIYLRVNRGGYTVGDWFVAYWIGDTATFSVTAHEGWHQYVARHLKGRLPPFLEEGVACLFEQVEWDGDLPRWDLTVNTSRLNSLRSAVADDQLYPLSQLVRMHAGQVVGKPGAKIEAFYGESWAFARFLREGNHGRNEQTLHRMLADAARGTLFADNSRQASEGPLWDPSTAKPMLEHYLGMPLPQIERAFLDYVANLVALSTQANGG